MPFPGESTSRFTLGSSPLWKHFSFSNKHLYASFQLHYGPHESNRRSPRDTPVWREHGGIVLLLSSYSTDQHDPSQEQAGWGAGATALLLYFPPGLVQGCGHCFDHAVKTEPIGSSLGSTCKTTCRQPTTWGYGHQLWARCAGRIQAAHPHGTLAEMWFPGGHPVLMNRWAGVGVGVFPAALLLSQSGQWEGSGTAGKTPITGWCRESFPVASFTFPRLGSPGLRKVQWRGKRGWLQV